MKRLLFCVFLMFVSCSNNQITSSKYSSSGNLVGKTEEMYSAYQASRPRTGLNVELAPVSNDNLTNDVCSISCVKKSLHIAITPMTASSPSMMHEIQNALTILKFGASYPKYHVDVVDNSTFTIQAIQTLAPDVIVGPFNEKDVLMLQKQVAAENSKAPIVSLASKNLSGGSLYNFGYRADAGVTSMLAFAKSNGYKTIAMISSNNEIGASNYKMFSSIAKSNGIEVVSVEFYEANAEDFSKYISRLKNASIRAFYQNVNTGKIQQDDFNFTKDITATEGNIITHSSGDKFYKKYAKVDAIILDASARDFQKIYAEIATESVFGEIPLMASPRVADGVIEMILAGGEKHAKEVLFPSNFPKYRDYYEIYKNTFNQAPTRLSSTIYETMQYILILHQAKEVSDINGVDLKSGIVIDGVNGRMVPENDGRTIRRIVDIYSFKDGEVTKAGSQVESVDNMENLL